MIFPRITSRECGYVGSYWENDKFPTVGNNMKTITTTIITSKL